MTEQTPTYRVKCVIDEDARFEECNGEARPLTETEYAENEYYKDGVPVPYVDYLAYQGNPDRHVYLGAVLERQCVCCAVWSVVGSLWHIDVMDDDPTYRAIVLDRYYAPDDPHVREYLRDVTQDLMTEAQS